jgi:hypothetical protein
MASDKEDSEEVQLGLMEKIAMIPIKIGEKLNFGSGGKD